MKRFMVVLLAAFLSFAFLSLPSILEARGGYVGSGFAGYQCGHYVKGEKDG